MGDEGASRSECQILLTCDAIPVQAVETCACVCAIEDESEAVKVMYCRR